jgi:hypothetical protein
MSTARGKRDLAAAATHSSQSLNPGRDKHLLFQQSGNASRPSTTLSQRPFLSRLAALVQQLETQEGIDPRARSRAADSNF